MSNNNKISQLAPIPSIVGSENFIVAHDGHNYSVDFSTLKKACTKELTDSVKNISKMMESIEQATPKITITRL